MPFTGEITTTIKPAQNGGAIITITNGNESDQGRRSPLPTIADSWQDAKAKHAAILAAINPDDYPRKPAPPVKLVPRVNPAPVPPVIPKPVVIEGTRVGETAQAAEAPPA